MPAPKQVQEFNQLLDDVQSRSSEARFVIKSTVEKVDEDGFETNSGLSFLEMKNHVMLDYLANLTYVMLRKCSGKSINGEKAIERICEDRTVLEKMKPIEKKLRYQIDKALKVAESGQLSSDDPLNFRPNIGALQQNDDDEDESSSDDDDDEARPNKNKSSSSGRYVPPKNVPAFMDDAETLEKNEEERKKKRNLSKSIVEDLRRQHLDLPEEEYTHVDTMRADKIARMKERIRYEEDNFIRLPLTKKDKHKRRQMTTIGTLGDELTYFGENNFFNETENKKRKGGRRLSKGAARKKFKKK